MTRTEGGNFKSLASLMDGARTAETTSPPHGKTTTAGSEKVSGVSPSRQGNTFANFDLNANLGMRDAFDRCLKVGNREAWCALLVGRPGNGKTHLAIAAMRQYGFMRSMLWKVPELLDWMKTMVFDKGFSIEEITRPYREQDILLVLDDLGVENQTDWAHEQLYRILDARYENKLPTIITSNQVPDRLDARLLSRYSVGQVVCNGKDVRRDYDE